MGHPPLEVLPLSCAGEVNLTRLFHRQEQGNATRTVIVSSKLISFAYIDNDAVRVEHNDHSAIGIGAAPVLAAQCMH